MNIERIVAATDFSASADAAVRRAALLARASGAKLELVHAINLPPLAEAWSRLAEDDGVSADRLRAGVVHQLDKQAVALAFEAGLVPVTRVLDGRPAAALAALAAEDAADLLVIGAHGEHRLLDLFVGSTALQLLRMSAIPVLLVNAAPAFDYRRVLIATDFSAAARAAAHQVACLLPTAELCLFHAYEVPFEREMFYAGSSDEAVGHYRRLAECEMRLRMAAFADSLAEPDRYSCEVRHGYAPAAIRSYGEEIGADLLVLGAHRRSGIEEALLGSVAAHLVGEARGDVLFVAAADG